MSGCHSEAGRLNAINVTCQSLVMVNASDRTRSMAVCVEWWWG